jgi:hypothetical protein
VDASRRDTTVPLSGGRRICVPFPSGRNSAVPPLDRARAAA